MSGGKQTSKRRLPRAVGWVATFVLLLVGWAIWQARSPGSVTEAAGAEGEAGPATVGATDPGTSREWDGEGIASRTNLPAADSGRLTAFGLLEGSGSFTEALSRAQVEFGTSDPRFAELETMANVACQDPDPERILGSAQPDERRAWAIRRIVEMCANFPYKPAGRLSTANTDADKLLGLQGAKAGEPVIESMAWEVVRGDSSDTTSTLVAGEYLINHGAMSLADRFPPGAAPTRIEMLDAWPKASLLAQCRISGAGCGPASLRTIAYCADVGCTPGSTYQQALAQNLSPRQYSVLLAVGRWLELARTRSSDRR